MRSAAVILALAFAAGCTPDEPPFLVEVRVSPTPATVGSARVLVEVRERGGSPAAVTHVQVRPVSPDGDAAPTVEAEAGGAGIWVADPVALPRPGSWTLEVSVAGPQGERVRREAPIEVVGGAPG